MIDLHIHTSHSDGTLGVNDVVNCATKNSVDIISITDHDTIEGLIEYNKNYEKKDILVIPGVELSTDTYYLGKKTKIHLLGYGYSTDNKLLAKVLNDLYARRYHDNSEYVENLIKRFSYLDKEYFLDFEYGKYGWLYRRILRTLEGNLTVDQLNELKSYLINNKPQYNKYNESVEEMISLIHACNGYSVVAHPQKCDVTHEELEKLIGYLSDIGLDGLETYHPESSIEERNLIHKLALQHGLYETGGSDFHDFKYGYIGDEKINFPVDYEPLLAKKIVKEKKVIGDIRE